MASRALIWTIPAHPDHAIPALQSTSPQTWGLLKWAKALDTSWVHCDNRSRQAIVVLLLSMIRECFSHRSRSRPLAASFSSFIPQKTYTCKGQGVRLCEYSHFTLVYDH